MSELKPNRTAPSCSNPFLLRSRFSTRKPVLSNVRDAVGIFQDELFGYFWGGKNVLPPAALCSHGRLFRPLALQDFACMRTRLRQQTFGLEFTLTTFAFAI